MNMRYYVRYLVVALLAGLCSGPWTIAAQAASRERKLPVGLASSYLMTRLGWIDREASADGCSLLRMIEAPDTFPRGFPSGLLPRFGSIDSLRSRCATPRESFALERAGYPPRIYFDSLIVHDTTATLFTTVVRGENAHRESVVAVRHADGWWGIVSFTITGMLRIH